MRRFRRFHSTPMAKGKFNAENAEDRGERREKPACQTVEEAKLRRQPRLLPAVDAPRYLVWISQKIAMIKLRGQAPFSGRQITGDLPVPQSLSCSLIAAALSLAAVAPASVLAEDSESPPEAAETRKYSGRGSAGGSSESPWMGEAVNVTAKGTAADVPYGSAAAGSKYQGQRGPTPSRYWENFK